MMGYLTFGGSPLNVSLRPFTDCTSKPWVTYADHLQNNKYTPHSLVCKSCGGPLGVDEEGGRCARLYKWNLCLRHGKNAAWQTLPVQRIICAKLLALIEGQATYKFLVYSGEIEDAQAALTVS